MSYKQYVEDVKSGNIVTCKYVKLAVKRYEDFLNRSDMFFDEEKVNSVIQFIGMIKLFEGDTAGQYFNLEPWQQFVIANIWGFYWRDENGIITGKRVTRNAFLFMSRKQGKSSFSAALALNQLVNDGENAPSVIFAANSTAQSHQLFEKAQQFSKSLDPKAKYLKTFRNEIRSKFNVGKLKIVSTDVKSIEGANASCYILDEYHQATNNDVLNSLKLSQGARVNPLGVIITTAGTNQNSPCKKLYDTSIDILSDLKQDDSLFSLIFTLDDNDDWKDEKVWLKSSPNMGVSVEKETINSYILEAINNVSQEVDVKSRVLNLWCSSSETWLSNQLIVDNSQDLNINDFKGYSCVVGVDLAKVSDLTCITWLVFKDDKYYFSTQSFLPFSALEEHEQKQQYKDWHYRKQIKVTEGNVTDYNTIQQEIEKINEILPVTAVYYDSWNSSQFVINMTDAGFNMQPFSQNNSSFNRPTKEFERLLKGGNIIIDNNEVVRYCFSNVLINSDKYENVRPVKSSNKNKIDCVVSMLTALGGHLAQPRYSYSVTI